MKDTRNALSKNSSLFTEKERKIIIVDEVGRGANCIVYDAIYNDSIGVKHKIRIKECYPNYLLVSRNETGELEEFEGEEEKFIKAKENFIEAYKKSADIRNTLSLTNSTINSTDIIEANNTIYIQMAMDEGVDYRKYEDESLMELLIHIRSLSKLISKYHEEGYLHLDIKPENILILPETEEHILLFDFDSVIAQEELVSRGRFRLSFSEGFSAPEQIQGEIEKIGTYTDIYSIGALLFYKLFGRKPNADDCRIYSKYNFATMRYASNMYQPKLYRVLETFLRKTLSVAVVSRWHEMQQVIECLNELIELADTEAVYLIDTFQYNSAYFVGRNEEINKIADILEQNQLVFLSGIGGIGKTEIAKQYANRFHERYDSVTFAVFEQNLEMLVCDDISINKVSRDEDEADKEYFERKIDILRRVSSKNDLVIIDNFDVDSDEQLELLLSCPCKFIFTTRKDYRDYNFEQINVDKIQNFEEIKELFYTYNDIEYDTDEIAAVEQFINMVDHHTMTVELIAKYLRNTKESPINLIARFSEKEGVTNTDDVYVKQRKDRKLRSETVNNHLSVLFDVFGFDEDEREIISSLSFFEGIRIRKNKFIEICQVDGIKEKLENLIKNGWIEYNKNTDKVSLHQVIQDIIYTKLKPDADNCTGIVLGMYGYVTEKTSNYSDKMTRKKVFDVFMNRITGSSIAYAKLCLVYGKNNMIKDAEVICNKLATPDAFDILQRIYRKKIKIACQCSDMFDTELEMEEYGSQQLALISSLLNKAIEYCKLASEEKEYRIKEFVAIADEVDKALEEDSITMYFGDIPELDSIYQAIISLYDWAAEKLPYSKFSAYEKEKLYHIIQKFYSDEDMYFSMYRYEHYGDVEKAYYYQNILDEIREEGEADKYEFNATDIIGMDESGIKRIWTKSVSSFDMAEEYRDKGMYEEAIEYYKKAYEEESVLNETIVRSISNVYLEMGETNSAIEYMEAILDAEKENEKNSDTFFNYSSCLCIDLIKMLIDQKDYVRARSYARELIQYKEEEVDEENNSYVVSVVLTAYYYLYIMEEDVCDKAFLWNKCIELYKKLGEDNIDEDLYDFLYEYLQKNDVDYAEILEIVERVNQWDKVEVKQKILSEAIERYKDSVGFEKYHVLMLLKLAELKKEYSDEKIKDGVLECESAQEIYDKYFIGDEYLQSLIYKIKSEIMSKDNDYEYNQVVNIKKKCNYWIIAKKQCEGCDIQKQVEIWNDAADNYRYIDDYQNELNCLNQSYTLLITILNQYNYSNFFRELWFVMQNQIRANINKQDFVTAEKVLSELYKYNIDYIIKEKDVDNRWDFIWRLKELAEKFDELDMKKQALYSYVIALYTTVADTIDETLIGYYPLDKSGMILACRKVDKLLDSVSIDAVDQVIDIRNELIKYTDFCENDWQIIDPIVKKIAELYQNQEIEFKQQ